MKASRTIAITGHVDHGKSTLLGHLLWKLGAIPDDRKAALERASESREKGMEWAFFSDALKAERDAQITVDTSQYFFRQGNQTWRVVDVPGHVEYLRHMVVGASRADVGLIIVGADAGIEEQTRRHVEILRFLGVEEFVVAINKLDLFEGDRRFLQLKAEFLKFWEKNGVEEVSIVPISAKLGQNLTPGSTGFEWFEGPSLIEALTQDQAPRPEADLGTALGVVGQYEGKIFAELYCGAVCAGDVLQGNQGEWGVEQVYQGLNSLALKLSGPAARGQILFTGAPLNTTLHLEAKALFFGLPEELNQLELHLGPQVARVLAIEGLEPSVFDIQPNLRIELETPIVVSKKIRGLGRFVLKSNGLIYAAGVV